MKALYTIRIVAAPKGAKRAIATALQGCAPNWKTEGNTIQVELEADRANNLYQTVRTLYTAQQVEFTPVPPKGEGHPTTHVDPETGAIQASVRPPAKVALGRVVPERNPQGPTIIDIPDDFPGAEGGSIGVGGRPPVASHEELEGDAIPWPYPVTRPDDIDKLHVKAREKHKLKDGKQRIRLGKDGERSYLVEPVRDAQDADHNKWRVNVMLPDGRKIRLGADEEWPGAIAFIVVYEQSLKPVEEPPKPPPAPPPSTLAQPQRSLKDRVAELERQAQEVEAAAPGSASSGVCGDFEDEGSNVPEELCAGGVSDTASSPETPPG